MHKGRLEAFSDGVIAIIITIMVLELKVPHGDQPADLAPLWPVFTSYALSFVYIGIYWNNHHHLLQAARTVNGTILWANLHLLFWLSLFPAATAWMGETHFATWPLVAYGIVLLCAGIAYYILAQALVGHHGAESALARAIGRDRKGQLSLAIYAVAIAAAFWQPVVARVLYFAVAIIWLVPDSRVEKTLKQADG